CVRRKNASAFSQARGRSLYNRQAADNLWGVGTKQDSQAFVDGGKAERSDPTNLLSILGDDKDSQIIGAGIRGDHEESDLLWIVGLGGAHELLPVAKCNFRLPPLDLGCKFVGFPMGGIAIEIAREEDSL